MNDYQSNTLKVQKQTFGDASLEKTVKEVVDHLVKSVFENLDDVQKKHRGRRGKDRREKHSVIKKSNVIDNYEEGVSQDEIAEKYNINRSLVS